MTIRSARLRVINRRTMLSLGIAWMAMLLFPAAGLAHRPNLLTVLGSNSFAVRPATIGYTGDGTGYVGGLDGRGRIRGRNEFGHIAWLTWAAHVAEGTGALWSDNGIPNDAEGTFSSLPVKIRAFAPRDGHFTRLTLRYEENDEKVIVERGLRSYTTLDGRLYEYFIVRELHEYVGTG